MRSVRVLGPVEVVLDGQPVALGGALPRRLVAALALDAGRVVPDDRLADAIWGADAPAKARAALQVYVSRLRAALGPQGDGLLLRAAGGYRLDVEPSAIDVTEFGTAVERGRSARAAGNAADAVTELSAALRMWRGEPYTELAASEHVDATRGRLAELHAAAQEELAAARLDAGDAAAVVADLTELAAAAPLRERRWALLALALYRSGRQGDALGALRRARRVLADELGVDPGAELQELERRVLAQDPGLAPAARAAPPTRRRPSVRRPLTSFLGRSDDVAALDAALAEHRLVTLVGTAGVGKTRIAVEYAARACEAQETWFARLAHVRDPGELPDVVAEAAGLPTVLGDPVAATVRVLADREGLLVLDNCEHIVDEAADVVLELLNGCPGLRILATSRTPLGIDGEIALPVAPLPADQATALFVERVRAVRPRWSPEAADTVLARRIVEALDGLPLAVELAAGRARSLGLSEIAERLDDRFALLGPVPRGSVAAHPSLETAIGWSVDLLDDRDRALLLRLWPFEGGFTLAAAAAVSAVGDVVDSLSTLVTRSVVEADTTSVPTRYLVLESVRAYCRTHDSDPAASRDAHARWVRVLAAGCITAVRSGRGGSYLMDLVPELPNLRAGLAHDLEHEPELALRSVGNLGLFLTRCMHNAEALRLGTLVLEAASDGDPVSRGRVLFSVNALRYIAGDHGQELIPQIQQVCAGLDEDDPLELCDQHYLLGFAAVMICRADIALPAVERAVDVALRTGVRGVLGPARAIHGVALLLQARLTGDDAELMRAVGELRSFTRGWTGALAQAAFGQAHLLCSPDAPDAAERAAVAVAALHDAAAAFHQESDVPFGLSALHLGVVALARVGRTTEARHLLADVRGYGRQLGVEMFAFLGPNDDRLGNELAALDDLPATARFNWDRAIWLLAPRSSDAIPRVSPRRTARQAAQAGES